VSRPVLYVAGGYASGFVAQCIKAEAERTGARIVGRLDLGPPKRRALRQTPKERLGYAPTAHQLEMAL
jgi:hypothetical protein